MELEQIYSKIFVGFFLTPDLRSKLLSSQQWKIDSLLTSRNDKLLREVRYHDKHYAGLYIDNAIELDAIRQVEKNIKDQLTLYLDSQEIRLAKLVIFPQLFIH